jgi:hypothetical protein
MILERDVEQYLVDRVEELGGEVRKVQWIGRRGAPDRFVMLPGCHPFFAEMKRPGGKPEPHQAREHGRMRSKGVLVYVIDTYEKVDEVLNRCK